MKPVKACKSLDFLLLLRISWWLSCLSVWCLFFFSPSGLHDESPLAYSQFSKCFLFKVSLVGIHFSCSHALRDAVHLVWVPPVLEWHYCHHVIAVFSTRQSRPSLFFPRVSNFTTDVIMHVVFSFKHELATQQQMSKVSKFDRCCPLEPSRYFVTCPWYNEGLLSCFLFFLLTRPLAAQPCLTPLAIKTCPRSALTNSTCV